MFIQPLNLQKERLQEILNNQETNKEKLEGLCTSSSLDIQQVEAHREYGIKLIGDAVNQERIISNTESILNKKQQEVKEAHQKVEILKKGCALRPVYALPRHSLNNNLNKTKNAKSKD